jgi:hypothetical protein
VIEIVINVLPSVGVEIRGSHTIRPAKMPSQGLAAPGRGGLDRRSDMPHKAFTGRAAGFFQAKMKLLHFFGSLAKRKISESTKKP